MSKISGSQIAFLYMAALALVMIPVFGLNRYYELDLPAFAGYLAVGVAILVHEVLVWRCGRPEPIAAPATGPGAVGESIPLLRALGFDQSTRRLFHMTLLTTPPLVALALTMDGEVNWILLLIALGMWGGFAATAASLRCPSCRTRLVPLRPGEWRRVSVLETCPHCDFRPPDAPGMFEPATTLGRVGLGAAYVASIAGTAMILLMDPPPHAFLPPDTRANREAKLDREVEDPAAGSSTALQ